MVCKGFSPNELTIPFIALKITSKMVSRSLEINDASYFIRENTAVESTRMRIFSIKKLSFLNSKFVNLLSNV